MERSHGDIEHLLENDLGDVVVVLLAVVVLFNGECFLVVQDIGLVYRAEDVHIRMAEQELVDLFVEFAVVGQNAERKPFGLDLDIPALRKIVCVLEQLDQLRAHVVPEFDQVVDEGDLSIRVESRQVVVVDRLCAAACGYSKWV